jgi:sporulation protein YlmC with PRC-barrel domain
MTNVVLNPVSQKVTHIALRDDKLPDNPTRLVPADKITNTTKDTIQLDCPWSEVAAMQPFVVSHLVQQSPSPSNDANAYASQYVFNDTAYEEVAEEELPEGTLGIVSGMSVEATDGPVGKLGALVLDPDSGTITHLQMREGHWWGKKDVVIPLSSVDTLLGGTVYLKLDKKTVKELPAVKVKQP